MTEYPVHDENHGLPVSLGYSVVYGSIVVQCGRCKDQSFAADSEWAERYLRSSASNTFHMVGLGRYNITKEQALEDVNYKASDLIKAGLITGKRSQEIIEEAIRQKRSIGIPL